jgi:ATP-binding cassette, subfamily C (CFTR/MRP), member 1
VPSFTAALGCFERIQSYLLIEIWHDDRLIIAATTPSSSGTSCLDVMKISEDFAQGKREEIPVNITAPSENSGRYALVLEKACFTYSSDSEPILQNLELRFETGSFTTIIGQVGSGKTSFLKAILGEMIIKSGKLHIQHSDVSYCQQTPWLPNITFREIVIGQAPFDEIWYTTVIHGCVLKEDINLLPDQDRSIIGSRGITLSGGQKQRLALARAVYARKKIVLLDDVLGALDFKTANLVFDRLLSKEGILRKLQSTIILVSHAGTMLCFPASSFASLIFTSPLSCFSRQHHCLREGSGDPARAI